MTFRFFPYFLGSDVNSVILSGKHAEKSALDLAEGKVNFFTL